jgi:hypothetical protein
VDILYTWTWRWTFARTWTFLIYGKPLKLVIPQNERLRFQIKSIKHYESASAFMKKEKTLKHNKEEFKALAL